MCMATFLFYSCGLDGNQVHSLDKGYNLRFEQGNQDRECPIVLLLPCGEEKIRSILGQVIDVNLEI